MQRQVRPVVREVEVTATPLPETTPVRPFELSFARNAVVAGLTLEDISVVLRSNR